MLPFYMHLWLSPASPSFIRLVPVATDGRIHAAILNWIYIIISLCGVGAGEPLALLAGRMVVYYNGL
jgi:hypothetical protein